MHTTATLADRTPASFDRGFCGPAAIAAAVVARDYETALARGEFAEAAELAAGVLDAGAHDPVSSCLARAIVATLTRIAGSPRDLENAASAAAVDVRKAVEAAGRTADEGRGVFAAAMVA